MSTRIYIPLIQANHAGTDGGGLAITHQAMVEIECPWFHDNSADGFGGGVAALSTGPNADPQLFLEGRPAEQACRFGLPPNEYDSELRGNHAAAGGGAIYMQDGTAAVLRTAFMGNTTDVQGSAIGLQAHPTNGAPTLTLQNALLHDNGDLATANVVRVQGGLFLGQHVTSADSLGVPFRFDTAAAGSVLQRSIVWDLVPKHIDAALNLDATCAVYRAVPTAARAARHLRHPGRHGGGRRGRRLRRVHHRRRVGGGRLVRADLREPGAPRDGGRARQLTHYGPVRTAFSRSAASSGPSSASIAACASASA